MPILAGGVPVVPGTAALGGIADIRYATRERVKRALDSAETARNNAQVDAATPQIDGLTHRVNTWIRATYGSNVIDFYGAIVDPSTGWMRAAVESGDGVHPNRYGHVDLADAVPIGRVV